MESIIEVDAATFVRNERTLLASLNWKVKPGEHWAILGANGSGKTSLLKLITGYEWVSKGGISVFDQRFGTVALHELRKNIGWVSASLDERYRTHEGMACVDVIVSGIHASIGVHEEVRQEDCERALKLASEFALETVAYAPLSTLSQGERKKTFLARSLMNHPDLLILDEPTSGLDLQAREQFLASIEKLLDTKTAPTLLYVTHHPEEIVPSITHVLLLKEGKILAAGLKEDVLTSEFVSTALGVPVTMEWQDNRPWARVQSLKSP
ncbi:ABC transporter ATP-binding protein [Shouchella shacheensis]|uniref:ABC transporter ATP-binding protein n=1 Tax=Shouchella shacheensis TaxID=1649580 RepID=UPI00073FF771|nr:ABC transporter ATP-binding protein [Shouchella shacheensis]